MNQQPTVVLVVGLSAALGTIITAFLSYRYSSRDNRENLKRDWELIKDMPAADFPARAKLAASIDARIDKLARFDRIAVQLRRMPTAQSADWVRRYLVHPQPHARPHHGIFRTLSR